MQPVNNNASFGVQQKYEQFEKSQIAAVREFETNPSIVNDPSKRLFKATPEGYMNLQGDEKTDAYKSSMLGLADGMIGKYDADENSLMDIYEFFEMNKTIQKGIDETIPDSFFGSEEAQRIICEGFVAADVNDDSMLDRKEIASTLAYTDYSNEIYDDNFNKIDGDGTLDGKIDLFKDTSADPSAKSNIAMFFDILFN